MEIKITEQKDNPVLSRTRIKFEIHQEGGPVPSRLEVVEKIASKLKKDKGLITIRNINADFGSANIVGEAILYSSKKALEKLEPKYTLKRLEAKEKAEAKPAPAEKPEEAKPEEQASEAPAEEPKAEEKPAEAEAKPEEPAKEEEKSE